MRLGFVTLGQQVPSTRFRILAMLPYLRSRGHECRVWTSWPSVYEHFPTIGWRASQIVKRSVRWQQLGSARWFRPDCIYLERGVFHDATTWMDEKFRRATRRLVLDVDDGIFLEFPEKIPRLLQMCDHAVVATPTIAEYVTRYTSNWTLIPTAVSMERYRQRPLSAPGQRPTIGWIGTGPNVAFLSVCADALRALARDIPFQLLVVAPSVDKLREIDLGGVDVRFEPWRAELEIEHLHQMDIGVMPLPENREWMRYKAATKLIQYLAVGIPAVASPIGVNADILKDNRVGLAARTTQEWIEALRTLLVDEPLRQRLGAQGRQLVREQFSVEANAPRLEQILAGAGT